MFGPDVDLESSLWSFVADAESDHNNVAESLPTFTVVSTLFYRSMDCILYIILMSYDDDNHCFMYEFV